MKYGTMNTQAIVQLDSGTADAIEEDVQTKWAGVELYSSDCCSGMSIFSYEDDDEERLSHFVDEVHDMIIDCGGCAHKTAVF